MGGATAALYRPSPLHRSSARSRIRPRPTTPVGAAQAIEAILEANEALHAAWEDPSSPYRAMAVTMATLAAHGRALRFLEQADADGRIDGMLAAVAREWLTAHIEELRTQATDPAATATCCERYLRVAMEELRRLTAPGGDVL